PSLATTSRSPSSARTYDRTSWTVPAPLGYPAWVACVTRMLASNACARSLRIDVQRPEDNAHCVIACQGSAHLLAALAAAGLRPSGGDGGRTFSVVVHDLHVPADQCQEFVSVVAQLTRVVPGCQAVRYVSAEQISALAMLRERSGYGAAARALTESLAL